MFDWKLISSDSHVVEPPDLWRERIARQFRDRAPRVISESDGDWWMIDGTRGNSFQGGAQVGKRFDCAEELRPAARFSEVRPGAYQPEEFLRENEEDGVWGSVIFPTAGLQLYRVPDLALLSACFRAYNDWLADFCRTAPDRLRGVAMINVEDVPEAIRELTRARRLGLAGAMITVAPPEESSYDKPLYEPFWAAAQDLDTPISLHIDTNRPAPHVVAESNRSSRASLLANADYWVRVALGHLVLEGVFERYPRLHVGSAEHDLAWVPYFLDRIDYTYTQRARRTHWHRYATDAVPSDFFRRNVFLSFQEDAMGIRDREVIGVDLLAWGSDYPHTESTFPRSRAILDRILRGVPDGERRLITAANAARLYHFDGAELGETATAARAGH
jgi:predicted TIM-barrel fold metal-dependent hydrolase